MSDKTWTMNCVLLGTELNNLLKEGKRVEVLEKLRNLTSEFDDVDANYLLGRVEELCRRQHQ